MAVRVGRRRVDAMYAMLHHHQPQLLEHVRERRRKGSHRIGFSEKNSAYQEDLFILGIVRSFRMKIGRIRIRRSVELASYG
jgi:hypothetical protein